MLDNCGVKKKSRKRANRKFEADGVCAGCGAENPEYVLDERQLCFDCYKAERYYWCKA